jgi:hypothetical protein
MEMGKWDMLKVIQGCRQGEIKENARGSESSYDIL